MNSRMRVPTHRLILVLSLVASLLLGASLGDAAQRKKPRKPLETGYERKLGVVYKTVGKRQLEFDMYYLHW
jgi:hypothetical protein